MNRAVLAMCAMMGAGQCGAEGVSGEVGADWYRPDSENLVLMQTTKGSMVIELVPRFAPGHVERVRTLVRGGRYDGTGFHRVIEGFMAQGGDIEGGSGLPDLDGEFTFRRDPVSEGLAYADDGGVEGFLDGFPVATQADHLRHLTKDGRVESWVRHCPGVVSMARTNDPDSANSQFFLMTHTSTWLDRKYTAFARILVGASVPGQMNKGEPPDAPDRIISARLVSEMPEDERPAIAVMRSDGDAFRQMLQEVSGDGGDICAIYPRLVSYRGGDKVTR